MNDFDCDAKPLPHRSHLARTQTSPERSSNALARSPKAHNGEWFLQKFSGFVGPSGHFAESYILLWKIKYKKKIFCAIDRTLLSAFLNCDWNHHTIILHSFCLSSLIYCNGHELFLSSWGQWPYLPHISGFFKRFSFIWLILLTRKSATPLALGLCFGSNLYAHFMLACTGLDYRVIPCLNVWRQCW